MELYKFDLGAIKYGFIPSPFQKTFEGLLYAPTVVKRSKLNFEANFNKNQVTFTFPKTHFFAIQMLTEVPEYPIEVTIYRGDDPDYLPYWTGRVISAESKTVTIDVQCDSIYSTMQRNLLSPKLSILCWASLYSEQCGVAQGLWQKTYSATADSTEVLISGLAEAEGYYNNGIAVMNNQQRRIVSNTVSHIYLSSPFTGVQTGTIFLYPGCKLTEEACTGFNNLINHKGFKNIPYKNPYGTTGLF